MKQALRQVAVVAGTVWALCLAGCGVGTVGSVSPAPVVTQAAGALGKVMGGQQPVGGSPIQLYAVGSGGYGAAATPLLTPGSVLTTAGGNFTLPSFTCPSVGSLVYLTATGGQPIAANGSTPAVTNNNLALMAGLGACSSVGMQYLTSMS